MASWRPCVDSWRLASKIPSLTPVDYRARLTLVYAPTARVLTVTLVGRTGCSQATPRARNPAERSVQRFAASERGRWDNPGLAKQGHGAANASHARTRSRASLILPEGRSDLVIGLRRLRMNQRTFVSSRLLCRAGLGGGSDVGSLLSGSWTDRLRTMCRGVEQAVHSVLGRRESSGGLPQ